MLEFIEVTAPPFIGNFGKVGSVGNIGKFSSVGNVGITAAQTAAEEQRPDETGPLPSRLEAWKIKTAPFQMLLDWNNVEGFSARSIQIGFEYIIEQCLASELDEFVVEDIVPGYTPGADDPAIVLEAEAEIVRIFQEASISHFRNNPEWRLSLRHGAFDIRFYLGKTRPFDRILPEDGFGFDEL